MIEKSVYSRMVISGNTMKSITDAVKANRPPEGIVALLPVTEKQFAGMEIIVGEYHSDVISSSERVVEV